MPRVGPGSWGLLCVVLPVVEAPGCARQLPLSSQGWSQVACRGRRLQQVHFARLRAAASGFRGKRRALQRLLWCLTCAIAPGVLVAARLRLRAALWLLRGRRPGRGRWSAFLHQGGAGPRSWRSHQGGLIWPSQAACSCRGRLELAARASQAPQFAHRLAPAGARE